MMLDSSETLDDVSSVLHCTVSSVVLECGMTDPTVAALRRLVAREGGHNVVAAVIGANGQSIYQVVAGIQLASGNPKGVGPGLRAKLSAHYPGWLDGATAPAAPPADKESLTAAQPDLATALPVVLDALASTQADRDEVAQILALLARTGAPAYRQRLAELLAQPAAVSRFAQFTEASDATDQLTGNVVAIPAPAHTGYTLHKTAAQKERDRRIAREKANRK